MDGADQSNLLGLEASNQNDISPLAGNVNKRSRPTNDPLVEVMEKDSFAAKLKQWNGTDLSAKKNVSKSSVTLDNQDCKFSEIENGLRFRLESEAHKRLCMPWKDALIVKLVGGPRAFG